MAKWQVHRSIFDPDTDIMILHLSVQTLSMFNDPHGSDVTLHHQFSHCSEQQKTILFLQVCVHNTFVYVLYFSVYIQKINIEAMPTDLILY